MYAAGQWTDELRQNSPDWLTERVVVIFQKKRGIAEAVTSACFAAISEKMSTPVSFQDGIEDDDDDDSVGNDEGTRCKADNSLEVKFFFVWSLFVSLDAKTLETIRRTTYLPLVL